MKRIKLLLVLMVALLGTNTNSFAQKKSTKKATPKKSAPTIYKQSIPEPPKVNDNMEGYKPVPELPPTEYTQYPKVAIDPSQEATKPVRKKKVYGKPFQFWPMVDTVIKEDYNIYLARKKAELKNYSTGKVADYKEPVIKSVYESCYRISNDKKDTTRTYGDGWTNRIENDANGNMVTLYVIFEDDVTKKDSAYLTTKYFYVGDKLKLKEFYWWASGRKEAETEIEYDANGKVWKEYYTPFDVEGKEIIEEGRGYRMLYTYKKDAIVEEQYERLEDAMNEYVLHSTTTKKLDAKGNVIVTEAADWPKDKPYSRYEKKYDAKGKLIYTGSESDYTTYSYNKNGDMEQLINTSQNYSRTVDYKYKYDKHNNWIEQLETSKEVSETRNVVETFLWKRKIDYHAK